MNPIIEQILKEKRERDYKKEYKTYHSKPEQVKRRMGRNRARAKLMRDGKVQKGDGMDVHHKDHNTDNNDAKNLAVMSASKNRGMNKMEYTSEELKSQRPKRGDTVLDAFRNQDGVIDQVSKDFVWVSKKSTGGSSSFFGKSGDMRRESIPISKLKSRGGGNWIEEQTLSAKEMQWILEETGSVKPSQSDIQREFDAILTKPNETVASTIKKVKEKFGLKHIQVSGAGKVMHYESVQEAKETVDDETSQLLLLAIDNAKKNPTLAKKFGIDSAWAKEMLKTKKVTGQLEKALQALAKESVEPNVDVVSEDASLILTAPGTPKETRTLIRKLENAGLNFDVRTVSGANVKLSFPDPAHTRRAKSIIGEHVVEQMVVEANVSANRQLWDKIRRKGVLTPIDMDEYPPIKGMEGPFRFKKDARILYYDPKVGRYYDRKTDMYLDRDDIPGI